MPLRRAWRVLGRGIRGVLEPLQGHEVFNPSVAAPVVARSLNQLTCVSNVCIKCGKPLKSQLSVLVADVDQAFECCTSLNVSRA